MGLTEMIEKCEGMLKEMGKTTTRRKDSVVIKLMADNSKDYAELVIDRSGVYSRYWEVLTDTRTGKKYKIRRSTQVYSISDFDAGLKKQLKKIVKELNRKQ